MDRDLAIARNRQSLLGVVAGLFAMIGLTAGGVVERLPRPLHRSVLRVLRSAEAAVRRLIFVAASDIVVEPRPRRPFPKGRVIARKGKEKGENKRRPYFNLFDPLKRVMRKPRRPKVRKPEPRARYVDFDPREAFLRRFYGPPAPPPPPPPVVEAKVDDGTVNAAPLCRRLLGLLHALEDLPRQVQRLARWQAQPPAERRPRRSSPLRAGRPPGFRQRPIHEVDHILKECHWLARQVPVLDSS